MLDTILLPNSVLSGARREPPPPLRMGDAQAMRKGGNYHIVTKVRFQKGNAESRPYWCLRKTPASSNSNNANNINMINDMIPMIMMIMITMITITININARVAI